MDEPKTRREKKKDQKEKGQGKNGKYSSKHIRLVIEKNVPPQSTAKGPRENSKGAGKN